MKKPLSKNLIKKRVNFAASVSFIVLMLIVTYAPILILVAYSFTDAIAIGVWNGFTFDVYKRMFLNSELTGALLNSLIIAFSSSLIATFLGTAAAVGIYYMRKYPKIVSNGLSQITMINADIVTSIGFMLFFVAVVFVPEGYVTLIIAHTILCLPYVIMSVMPRLSQLNPNVYEAGLDLGADHMRTFFTVVLPQLVSSMIAGFMLAFTISLDDFTISIFINGNVKTIPIYIYDTVLQKPAEMDALRALSAVLLVGVIAVLAAINFRASRRAKKLKMLKVNN